MRAGGLRRGAAVLMGMMMVSGAAWTRAAQVPDAQQGTPLQQQTAAPPAFGTSPDPGHDPMKERMLQQAIQHENEARHKRMSEDAAQLVALSTELKAEVDKTGKDQLSVDVIRKADAIEKLAHSVKERMRQ